jgi:hypothetical protein
MRFPLYPPDIQMIFPSNLFFSGLYKKKTIKKKQFKKPGKLSYWCLVLSRKWMGMGEWDDC